LIPAMVNHTVVEVVARSRRPRRRCPEEITYTELQDLYTVFTQGVKDDLQ
jgi:hypothetical protein